MQILQRFWMSTKPPRDNRDGGNPYCETPMENTRTWTLLARKSCSLWLGMDQLQEKFTPLQSTSTIDPTETLWNSGEVGIKWCIPSASPLHRGDFHLQCEFSLSKWSNISQLLLVSIDQREINAWKKFCGYTQFSKWNWRGESSADGILLAWRDGKLKF